MNEQQLEIPGLIMHEPIRPARKGHIGETVYAERWRELMAAMPPDWSQSDLDECPTVETAYLDHILADLGQRVTQRDASVAASFVTWLGCNIGRLMLEKGRKLRTPHGDLGIFVSWCIHNTRRFGINSGCTAAELMLRPEIDVNGPHVTLSGPDVSARDLEVIGEIARWLDGGGRGFVLGCEAEIDKREAFEQARIDRAYQAKITAKAA